MKICPNCSFENQEESYFCQECGNKLNEIDKTIEKNKYVWTCDLCGEEFDSKKECDEHEKECLENKKKEKIKTKSIYKKLSDTNISDVIFEPKVKKHFLRDIFFIFISIMIIIIIIIVIAAAYSTPSDGNSNSSVTTETQNKSNYFSAVELSYLKLNGGDMTGNSYYEPNPVYKATLHNAGSIMAKNVIIKINFYKADDTSTTAMPQDTQYLKAADFLGSGDSTYLNTIIQTGFNTSGRFRWYAEVFSAEKY